MTMGDYNDALLHNPNAAIQAHTKAQNHANVTQFKLIGQGHPTGLTTNLLKLFEPRPPLEYKPPPENRKCPLYSGMAQFVSHFAVPGYPEYAPPIQEGETPGGSVFAAAGDCCAYCWDLETCKIKMIFKGHSDTLHSIVARTSRNQIITSSENGEVRIWDCKSGKCTQIIDPGKDNNLKPCPYISCITLDKSESWLVCESGKLLSLWNLPALECVSRITTNASIQDAIFDNNEGLICESFSLFMNLLSDGFYWTLLKCIHGDQKVHSAPKFVALKAECNSKLAVALTIMEECFLPMVDPRTGIDMIPQVVYNWGSEVQAPSYPRMNF